MTAATVVTTAVRRSMPKKNKNTHPVPEKKHPPFNKNIRNICRYRPRCSRTNTTTDVPRVGLAAMCSVATYATWSTMNRVCPRTPGPTKTNRSNGHARHASKNKKNNNEINAHRPPEMLPARAVAILFSPPPPLPPATPIALSSVLLKQSNWVSRHLVLKNCFEWGLARRLKRI